MKLSKDYISLFREAVKLNATESMILVFEDLCKEIKLEAESGDISPDEARAISIATLFNEKNKGQNGKPI